MFVQSFQGNFIFLVVLNLLLFTTYTLGEFWIHRRALYLFPRYFQYWVKAIQTKKHVHDVYELNENEIHVLQKFGRIIVMIVLIIYIMSMLLLSGLKLISVYISLSTVVVLFLLLFYHYKQLFRIK